MTNLDRLIEAGLEARNALRDIASGKISDYDRQIVAEKVALNINFALVPYVGIGAKAES